MTRGLDLEKVQAAGGPPSMPEAAAVFAAVAAYRQTMGLPPADMDDAPVAIAELKKSIDKLEAVTITEGQR